MRFEVNPRLGRGPRGALRQSLGCCLVALYSALAWRRMGSFWSAFFQSARKSSLKVDELVFDNDILKEALKRRPFNTKASDE